jgi:Glycosyl transferase family 2
MPRSKYADDGLTQCWFDQIANVPKDRTDWWATDAHGRHPFGFSYCIVNAHNDEKVAAIKQQLAAETTAPFEIHTFAEDKPTMPELFPHCRYSWTQRISDDDFTVDPNYNPKISIVMTTFKRQHCILRTVGWVLAQDYTNWELIIIDNEKNGAGLPPMPNDSRIKTYNICKESNTAYPRNEGVKLATGDIVCNFDDDDEMRPGFFTKMVAPFCNPEVQVVRCGMLLVKGGCDFSYSTQEAWLRREFATPTWTRIPNIHDQIYYRDIIDKNKWTNKNIVQLGEVLVTARTEPQGGRRSFGAQD